MESVTCAVNLYVPGVVGVPVTAPVVASSVSPGGKLPVPGTIEKVYGGVLAVAPKAED